MNFTAMRNNYYNHYSNTNHNRGRGSRRRTDRRDAHYYDRDLPVSAQSNASSRSTQRHHPYSSSNRNHGQYRDDSRSNYRHESLIHHSRWEEQRDRSVTPVPPSWHRNHTRGDTNNNSIRRRRLSRSPSISRDDLDDVWDEFEQDQRTHLYGDSNNNSNDDTSDNNKQRKPATRDNDNDDNNGNNSSNSTTQTSTTATSNGITTTTTTTATTAAVSLPATSYPNSNSSSISTTAVEELISCTICCSIFSQPITMLCGHTFCRRCILKWYFEHEDKTISTCCPTCREDWGDVNPRSIKESLMAKNLVSLHASTVTNNVDLNSQVVESNTPRAFTKHGVNGMAELWARKLSNVLDGIERPTPGQIYYYQLLGCCKGNTKKFMSNSEVFTFEDYEDVHTLTIEKLKAAGITVSSHSANGLYDILCEKSTTTGRNTYPEDLEVLEDSPEYHSSPLNRSRSPSPTRSPARNPESPDYSPRSPEYSPSSLPSLNDLNRPWAG